MVSFGIEDFAEKYGSLAPSQFVDVISLVGDKSDNIPGYFVIVPVKLISQQLLWVKTAPSFSFFYKPCCLEKVILLPNVYQIAIPLIRF